MRFVNLTAHAIRLYDENGLRETIPPDGRVARIWYDKRDPRRVGEYEVYSVISTKINHLPPPAEGVIYIVSTIVAFAAAVALGRTDVIAPDGSWGSGIRDPQTNVVLGVQRFHAFAPDALSPRAVAA